MKRLLKVFALVAAIMLGTSAVKAERVYMPVKDMTPASASAQIQRFLDYYYPGVEVSKSWAKMMRATTEPMWYRVNLSDGTKLWFDLAGNWYQVSAKHAKTPASIDLLPNDARQVISEQYKDCTIKSVKFKKDQYKVKLSDGTTLVFDKTYGLKAKKNNKGIK